MAAPAHMIEAVEAAMKHIQAELRAELEAQGHRLTGALEESVQYRVFSRGSTVVVGEMSSLSYGFAIELGVPASRIPYSGRSGRGGRSAYIQGLVRFFELRGLEPREALSAAFATATVHKREGMPTASSFGFSSKCSSIRSGLMPIRFNSFSVPFKPLIPLNSIWFSVGIGYCPYTP